MVYAFILNTVGSKEVHVIYYKIYTCYGQSSSEVFTESFLKSDQPISEENSIASDQSRQNENALPQNVLFESLSEKKGLVNHVSSKVHMHYSLKIKQSLIPVTIENDSKITGVFKERNWKNLNEELIVVWQGVRGFGFTLLCKKNENVCQAKHVLDILITQLEKQIKFFSEPLVAVKLIETVALIVNNYLPGGQLLYFNSKMLKSFEKKVEVDLYAK